MTLFEYDKEEEIPPPIINKSKYHHNGHPHIPAQPSSRLQPTENVQCPPPYPETLNLDIPLTQPEFKCSGELRNVCVRIPLFQAIKMFPFCPKLLGSYAWEI